MKNLEYKQKIEKRIIKKNKKNLNLNKIEIINNVYPRDKKL